MSLFAKVEQTLRYSYHMSPKFLPFNFNLIIRNIESSARLFGDVAFASMFVHPALVIMASTCKRKLFKSKYISFAAVTVNLINAYN